MTTRRTRQLLGLMVAGAIPAAAWVSTPVVHADTVDDAFIAVLDDQGIAYRSVSYAINAGHFVCLTLANGTSLLQATEMVYQESALTSRYDSAYFVGAAASAYCPWELKGQAA